MKKSFVYAVLVSSSLMFLTACKDDSKKVTSDLINFPQTANGTVDMDLPVMAFDSLEHHFGKIAIGEKVLHSFHFKNDGNAPLIISHVTPSCGCTTLKDWPKEPIAPGAEGQITVEFNSNGNSGNINKSIHVATNAVPKDWYLRLIGEVSGVDPKAKEYDGFQMERER